MKPPGSTSPASGRHRRFSPSFFSDSNGVAPACAGGGAGGRGDWVWRTTTARSSRNGSTAVVNFMSTSVAWRVSLLPEFEGVNPRQEVVSGQEVAAFEDWFAKWGPAPRTALAI